MNNFCIAPCVFSAAKLLRDNNKNLEHLFDEKPIKHVFGVSPSVGVENFCVDLDGMHVFVPTPSVGVVHIWVVCT